MAATATLLLSSEIGAACLGLKYLLVCCNGSGGSRKSGTKIPIIQADAQPITVVEIGDDLVTVFSIRRETQQDQARSDWLREEVSYRSWAPAGSTLSLVVRFKRAVLTNKY